jgi:hypothetical protein
MVVEYLRDQARHGDGAASGGGLGFGPFAADLGRGFEHLQLEMRDVESSYARAGDLVEAQSARRTPWIASERAVPTPVGGDPRGGA